ncbi:MAG: DNA replication/repair protein RecF [Oscillospiraceae bacterium]|nr:DNA replication/repair protein RecF [Oscillospiraceae bacterium]
MNNCSIKTLKLENYRNIKDSELEFVNGINVITGENGQGKTNLIEALWLLTGGKSFRGSKDKDLINKDLENENRFARIVSVLENDGYEEKIELLIADTDTKKGRFAKHNDGQLKRAVSIVGRFYCVVFCPQHLSLVSGSPSLRRKFVDGALCQLYPNYIKVFKTFEKYLEQKNSLLKNQNRYYFEEFSETLDIYNRHLAALGYEIYLKRKEYIDLMSQKAKEYYSKISSGRESIDFKYISFGEDPDDFYNLLVESIERDKRAGFSTCGVQREDIEITINGETAKDFASQGQQRSIVLSMKLAESDILKEICEIDPVILLDDVLSELDFKRQEYLLDNIEGKQVFISSCDENRINLAKSRKYFVKEGVIECM